MFNFLGNPPMSQAEQNARLREQDRYSDAQTQLFLSRRLKRIEERLDKLEKNEK